MLDIQFNFEINYLFTAGLWNNNNNKKKGPYVLMVIEVG